MFFATVSAKSYPVRDQLPEPLFRARIPRRNRLPRRFVSRTLETPFDHHCRPTQLPRPPVPRSSPSSRAARDSPRKRSSILASFLMQRSPTARPMTDASRLHFHDRRAPLPSPSSLDGEDFPACAQSAARKGRVPASRPTLQESPMEVNPPAQIGRHSFESVFAVLTLPKH